jgi:hypothetical protein
VGILVKLIVIVWAVYLLSCFWKGARMWAPYYTLQNSPEDRPWRVLYAFVTLGVLGATCYWLIEDLLG